MNATDTFIEEYKAALTAGAAVALFALADACCKLVRQLKTDGFQVEQVILRQRTDGGSAGKEVQDRASGSRHEPPLRGGVFQAAAQCRYVNFPTRSAGYGRRGTRIPKEPTLRARENLFSLSTSPSRSLKEEAAQLLSATSTKPDGLRSNLMTSVADWHQYRPNGKAQTMPRCEDTWIPPTTALNQPGRT